MENVGKSSLGHRQGPENFQGAHIWGALRGHLCDSTAFLFCMAYMVGLLVKRVV